MCRHFTMIKSHLPVSSRVPCSVRNSTDHSTVWIKGHKYQSFSRYSFYSSYQHFVSLAILRFCGFIPGLNLLHIKTNNFTEDSFNILADLTRYNSISYKVGVICVNHPGKSGKFR